MSFVGPKDPDEPYLDLITQIYRAATDLWGKAGVERHAEGHPGICGPSGKVDENWSLSKGTLDGAIQTLQTVRDRLFTFKELLLKNGWIECSNCNTFHDVREGCRGPEGECWNLECR